MFVCVCVSVCVLGGEGEKSSRRAKVIYSYAAQCDDELTLELGKVRTHPHL